jgi:surface protein
MFEAAEKLVNLDLSSFKTSKVTDMDGMFTGCTALRNINLSSFNTSKVEYMQYMFENCSSLEMLDLSSFSSAKLDDGWEYNEGAIWLMFYGCSSLRTIYVSNNFVITCDPSATTTGNGVFDGCDSLVGGNGTRYSDEHIYADYACIDTAEHPGYFTYREAPEPGPTPGPTPAPISSISVNSAPTKLSYDVGERFNPAGLKIKLNYATGGSAIVTYDNSTKDNFSFNPSLTTALTETNTYVTITYSGKTCRQNITVLPVKDIASISIVKKPNTTSYYAGYRLKPDGLVVRAHYTDGTTTDITYSSGNADRFTFNPTLTTNLTIYMNEVEVTYRGMTATFAISVTKNSGGNTPSGGGGSSGGGGGSATTGPIPPTPTSYTPTTTVVAATKAISGTLDASNVNWAVDPTTGKWILGTAINGQSTLVSNGFFQINSTATQNVYGIATQVPVSNTYYFDATGAMVTGWVKTGDNKWYFFENAKTANEGKMQVGWKVVEGSWYFFGADGAMYENQVTPDGHVIGADGRWVQA